MPPLMRAALVVIALVGLLILWFAGIEAAETLDFRARAVRVEAEVSRIEISEDRDRRGGDVTTSLRPWFNVPTAEGLRELPSAYSSDFYDFDVGEQMEVLYLPDDPKEVRIADFISNVLPTLSFAMLGLMMVGMSILAWRVMR